MSLDRYMCISFGKPSVMRPDQKRNAKPKISLDYLKLACHKYSTNIINVDAI